MTPIIFLSISAQKSICFSRGTAQGSGLSWKKTAQGKKSIDNIIKE